MARRIFRVFLMKKGDLEGNVFGYCVGTGGIAVNDARFTADFLGYEFPKHLQIVPAGILMFEGKPVNGAVEYF